MPILSYLIHQESGHVGCTWPCEVKSKSINLLLRPIDKVNSNNETSITRNSIVTFRKVSLIPDKSQIYKTEEAPQLKDEKSRKFVRMTVRSSELAWNVNIISDGK